VRNDAAVFFQSAEHTLNEVVLPALGTIKQTRQTRLRFTLHAAQSNHRLHEQCVKAVGYWKLDNSTEE